MAHTCAANLMDSCSAKIGPVEAEYRFFAGVGQHLQQVEQGLIPAKSRRRSGLDD